MTTSAKGNATDLRKAIRKKAWAFDSIFRTMTLSLLALVGIAGCDGTGTSGSPTLCGNGSLDPGEACDDSNTMAGDGCSSDCQTVEAGFVCSAPGSLCVATCGDGTCDAKGGETSLSCPSDCASSKPIEVWGGARSCIVLKKDGTVWDWGVNGFGKLGNGMPSGQQLTPVQVHGPGDVGFLQSITAIMGGETHNFALKSDGTVWSWGANSAGNLLVGQLGDGTFTDRYTPVQVHGPGNNGFLTSITALGGRGYHSLVIKSDSTVWSWGRNVNGQLGNGLTGDANDSNLPVQVHGVGNNGFLSSVTFVSGGGFHSLAIMNGGTVVAWGGNGAGQLGDTTTTERDTPVQISGFGTSPITKVSAGWVHSLALDAAGNVWAWGGNANGEIGDGTTVNRTSPYRIPELSGMMAVSAGDCHSAALKSDGTVWTWGCNAPVGVAPGVGNDELGDGSNTERHKPVAVSGLTNVMLLAARDYHNIAVKSDGSVWTWGFNANGQLGNGTTTDSNVPVPVTGFGPTQ